MSDNLKEILLKIKSINDDRLLNNRNLIAYDDTNEEIINILSNFFLDELQNGIDIDSVEFLSTKFSDKYELIREAESGIYDNKTKKGDREMEAYKIQIKNNAGNGKKLIEIINILDSDCNISSADKIDLTQYAISLINI